MKSFPWERLPARLGVNAPEKTPPTPVKSSSRDLHQEVNFCARER